MALTKCKLSDASNSFEMQFFKLYGYILDFVYWDRVCRQLSKGDILFIQHPMPSSEIVYHSVKKLKAKGVYVVMIIHDLYTIRENKDISKRHCYVRDFLLPNECDVVISHNVHMTNKLKSLGMDQCRFVDLGIFDYIWQKNASDETNIELSENIIIAGNLSRQKSGYLYDTSWLSDNITIELYGANWDGEASEQIHYHGNFNPDDLPEKLEKGFGLVWDGYSSTGCKGSYGDYLKINNPHKASLYLSVGLPVIVWRESAMADFVAENGIGLCIDDLEDIKTILESLTESELQNIYENVARVSAKIRSGMFFEEALSEAMRILCDETDR